MTCSGPVFLIWAQLTCTQAVPPDTFCQIAQPIRWSKDDTRITKEQADKHNRKGKALCGWK